MRPIREFLWWVFWLAGSGWVGASDFHLATVLDRNRMWMGGDDLAAIRSVEIHFLIQEGEAEYRGRYRALAQGKMCVEIFVDETMVYTEGWDGERGWQWSPDRKEPEPTSPAGTAALRHGLELPGHFLALADLTERGHQVSLDGREMFAGVYHPLVKVVLSDGHTVWYLVHATTGAILKSRSFKALHPDLDPNKTWMETRFADYRKVNGVTRAFKTEQINLFTRKVVQTTRLEKVESNGEWPDAIFSGIEMAHRK